MMLELAIIAAAAIIGAGSAAAGCSSRTAKDVTVLFCLMAAGVVSCMFLIQVFE